MSLRCLLFSSDQGAAQLVSQVLADLRIDAENCPDAVTATELVTSQLFQIVIVDWDDQPDAAFLLNTARTRKALERPLTLAIVADEADVPKALQAGANSILRKPILSNQVRDTLATARDLLRAKLEQAASTSAPLGKQSASASRGTAFPGEPSRLRAREFLQSSAPAPGAQFIIESDHDKALPGSESSVEVDLLEDLEPMAATLEKTEETPVVPPAPAGQPRGLAWYLKSRAVAAGPAPAPVPPTAKAELLGYDRPTSDIQASPPAASSNESNQSAEITNLPASAMAASQPGDHARHSGQSEGDAESQLFAYIAGEQVKNPQPASARFGSSLNLPRLAGALLFPIILIIAYWRMPPKTWKPGLHRLSSYAIGAGHAWLNPQTATPPQAPRSHENFGRAGDEYKLPVAETIPDASTDPSQIHVLPVIDPTVKQPNATGANENQSSAPDAPAAMSATDQQSVAATSENLQNKLTTPVAVSPSGSVTTSPAPGMSTEQTNSTVPSVIPSSAIQDIAAAASVVTPRLPAPRPVQPQYQAVRVGVPSSLKSQMATTTPEASGNKPPEAALPSIEPVNLPEAAARALLLQQPLPAYPESARGQSGTVILQILVGRDGSVQDAKFLQGSLAFARTAIDAVKQWRFQPYTMNGRAVSTVTSLTLSFKPAF